MAPTICSGKKRQTTNIRRHGQRSNQLNQALSNIVNYVAKGSLNPRVAAAASLRIQDVRQTENDNYRNNDNNEEANLNYNHLTQTSATAAAKHRRQQYSFLSDNAVTSSTQSDTENSYDLRLANNESLTNESTATYDSNTNPSTSRTSSSTMASSLLSTAAAAATTTPSSSQKETTSSSLSLSSSPPRKLKKYSSKMQANDQEDVNGSENNTADLYKADNENDDDNNKNNKSDTNQIHSSNIRQHYFTYNDYELQHDDDDDDDADADADDDDYEEYNDMSESERRYDEVSATDMDTDDTSDSMTSLDTEKSAKLKRGNHPQLRDKILANHDLNNNCCSSNTDGLLSIAIKTITLVKRNKLLQQRLTQLQLETSEFIQSVLANPENKHFRENMKQKGQEVENV